MSRSYREPWTVDGYGTARKRWMKRYANKVVRSAEDVPNGRAYRKIYDTYNICEYRWKWDPRPSVYCWDGEIKVIDPEPLYRVRSK